MGLGTSGLDPQTMADLSAEHAKCSASDMFTPYGNMSTVQSASAEFSSKAGAGYFGPSADLDAGFGSDCGVPGWQPEVTPDHPSSTIGKKLIGEDKEVKSNVTDFTLSCVAVGCIKAAFDASDRVLCYCSAECRSADLLRNPDASRDNKT